jgi:2-iminobutanoate/2-iminopropanoate deaminase
VTAQTGRDPDTGKLEEGLEAQTRRMLSNIDAILNAAGCSAADIVKVTLAAGDIKDFKAVDVIYAEWLPGLGITPLPARTAFATAALPAGALVMLDVIAAFPRPDERACACGNG